jgi:hypothetical protein
VTSEQKPRRSGLQALTPYSMISMTSGMGITASQRQSGQRASRGVFTKVRGRESMTSICGSRGLLCATLAFSAQHQPSACWSYMSRPIDAHVHCWFLTIISAQLPAALVPCTLDIDLCAIHFWLCLWRNRSDSGCQLIGICRHRSIESYIQALSIMHHASLHHIQNAGSTLFAPSH